MNSTTNDQPVSHLETRSFRWRVSEHHSIGSHTQDWSHGWSGIHETRGGKVNGGNSLSCQVVFFWLGRKRCNLDVDYIFLIFFNDQRSAIRINPATAIMISILSAVLALWICFYCQLIIQFSLISSWTASQLSMTFHPSFSTTRNLSVSGSIVDPLFVGRNLWWSDPEQQISPGFFPSGSELNMSQAIHYCLRTSVRTGRWSVRRFFMVPDVLTKGHRLFQGKYMENASNAGFLIFV